MEASQGIQNALPKDTSVLGGLNEATYLAQQAKAHNFNVMRLFGIADVNYNEGMPLQPSPGQHSRLCSAPANCGQVITGTLHCLMISCDTYATPDDSVCMPLQTSPQ